MCLYCNIRYKNFYNNKYIIELAIFCSIYSIKHYGKATITDFGAKNILRHVLFIFL